MNTNKYRLAATRRTPYVTPMSRNAFLAPRGAVTVTTVDPSDRGLSCVEENRIGNCGYNSQLILELATRLALLQATTFTERTISRTIHQSTIE